MAGSASALLAAPSDQIRMGFIGLGGMGMNRLRGFLRHADAQIVALCDLDEGHVAQAKAAVVAARPGTNPETMQDFRKLLERKDVDAVCIATPDHWHALPTVQACRAGKDVFVEKPLSFSVGEGRAMVKAAQANQRVTQMGNHIHNDLPNYRRVVELVRSGVIGKVQHVHLWRTSEVKGLGTPPNGKPPANFDYAMWQGPAPKREYNENRSHFKYRYFWDYSGGMFIDFWCHITDVAYWALDLQAPTTIQAAGRREVEGLDNGETPNFMDATLVYPNLTMTWALRPQAPLGFEQMGIGCVFVGTQGNLVTDYGSHKIFVKGKEVTDFKRPEPSIPDSPGHLREFLDSVKSRKLTTCDVAYGHKLTKAGLLANIAYRTKETLTWDDAREQFTNSKEANKMVTRRYQKPWKL